MTRRSLLRLSSLAAASAGLPGPLLAAAGGGEPIHLNLNENAFGPSPRAAVAVARAMGEVSRYADDKLAGAFTEQVAAYERVPAGQIVLGEILGGLGLYLGAQGGPGGELLYSTPGFLALVDAAANVGSIGVPVPLNANHENDLPALRSRIAGKTRGVYLINPHNPSGTVSEDAAFKSFLRDASQRVPVIVDEAYLEYTPAFEARSAVSVTREGGDVLVFRTFDKIHGLAGLPIGYLVAPKPLAAALRKQGLGAAEGLGRINLVAAAAALADREHAVRVRASVAEERAKWHRVLDELKLPHTSAQASFVFFQTDRPQLEIASGMLRQGVLIARAFPPYGNWCRITIGLPEENLKAQQALRATLAR